jgi:hypothetical protein
MQHNSKVVVADEATGAQKTLSNMPLLKRNKDGERHDTSVMPSSISPKQTLEETRLTQQFVKFNKRGRKVMKEITTVSISDLKDLTVDDGLDTASYNDKKTPSMNNMAAALQGKEKVVALLRRAGILQMDVATVARLPTWKAISDLYYNGNQNEHKAIVVHGASLDQNSSCRDFARNVPRHDAYLAPAGLFNSGTNALTYYLRANLVMPHMNNTADDDRFSGILTQVPWHKHWLSRLRYNHTIPRHEHFNKDHVLPIVIIRDPLSWAQSMCQHPYDVKWSSSHTTITAKQHCPNFVTTHNEDNGKQQQQLQQQQPQGVPVQIPVMTGRNVTWPSLLHLWQDWYRDYLTSSKPFLMIRHEDLLFHPEQVIAAIQECSGAARRVVHGSSGGGGSTSSSSSNNSSNNQVFTYVMDAAKWEHQKVYGPQSNRISAMIKQGNAARRIRNMTRADLEYAKAVLDIDADDADNDNNSAGPDTETTDNEQQQRTTRQRHDRLNLLRLFQYTLPHPITLDTA